MLDLDPWIDQQSRIVFDLPVEQALFRYYPEFISPSAAAKLFDLLIRETPWRSDKVKVFGKWYDQPRLTAWYATSPRSYSYSGLNLDSLEMTDPLNSLLKSIEQKTDARFNSVLLNLYRDGKDSNGWHSDDEKELGPDPTIASVSLGEARVFQLKHKTTGATYKFTLKSGSLLLMGSRSQIEWKHQLPKTKTQVGPRINGTFRWINQDD